MGRRHSPCFLEAGWGQKEHPVGGGWEGLRKEKGLGGRVLGMALIGSGANSKQRTGGRGRMPAF